MRMKFSVLYLCLRLLVALLFCGVFVCDVWSSYLDPQTYEAVYTGVFYGEYAYDTLAGYRAEGVAVVSVLLVYMALSVLTFAKSRGGYAIVVLRSIEVLFVLYLLYKFGFVVLYSCNYI